MADSQISQTSQTDDVGAHTALLRDQEDQNHDEAEVKAQPSDSVSSPVQGALNDNNSVSQDVQPPPMVGEARSIRLVSQAPQPSVDDSILGVPRETVEEMMRAWTKVLIQSLRKEGDRTLGGRVSEDVELGNMQQEEGESRDQAQASQPIATDISASGDCWWGQPVEVWSEQQQQEEAAQRLKQPCLYDGDKPFRTVYRDYYVPNDLWAPFWVDEESSSPPNEAIEPLTWCGTTGLLDIQNRLALAYRSVWDASWPESSWCRIKLFGERLRDLVINQAMVETYILSSDQAQVVNEQVYVAILLEYLWDESSGRKIMNLNSMLETCYRKGILQQKTRRSSHMEGTNSLSETDVLLYHAAAIIQAVGLINFTLEYPLHHQWASRNLKFHFADNTRQTVITVADLVGYKDDSASLKTEDLAQRLHVYPVEGHRNPGYLVYSSDRQGEAEGTHFRPEDLRISLLQSVGNIVVQWTDKVDNHLQMSERCEKLVLYLWW